MPAFAAKKLKTMKKNQFQIKRNQMIQILLIFQCLQAKLPPFPDYPVDCCCALRKQLKKTSTVVQVEKSLLFCFRNCTILRKHQKNVCSSIENETILQT